MKKKLVPVLSVIGAFFVAGSVVTAAQAVPSSNTGVQKTVAISNVPSGGQAAVQSSQSGGIYNQIMQSQKKMNAKMSKYFNDPFYSNSSNSSSSFANMGMQHPQTRFFEKDGVYVLQLVTPGMDKENISIELHGNMLVISAKNSEEAESKSNNHQSYQQVANAFTRSYNIPHDVDIAKITSNYKNGVLTVDLPKDLAKATQKSIKISVE